MFVVTDPRLIKTDKSSKTYCFAGRCNAHTLFVEFCAFSSRLANSWQITSAFLLYVIFMACQVNRKKNVKLFGSVV